MSRIVEIVAVQELNASLDLGPIAHIVAFDPDAVREIDRFAGNEGAIVFGDKFVAGKALSRGGLGHLALARTVRALLATLWHCEGQRARR